MRRALDLAARGLGWVEPNPPVGAVLVDENRKRIAEGWHREFGGPHAEMETVQRAGPAAAGATLFVTLEPCCHQGKTPPCTAAIIRAGIARVVIGTGDPAPHAAGEGIAQLRAAGIDVREGLLAGEIRAMLQPYLKLVSTGLPYVHAKWAMTLDGKIASRSGASQWISGLGSRKRVHRLRGRMDAILVGVETALADDPLLTARPPGPRRATRIVLDTHARLTSQSRLVQTAEETPVLLATGDSTSHKAIRKLEAAGVEILRLATDDSGRIDPGDLLQKLGQRRMTNVLVEGGSELLGSFFDRNLIDEAHIFLAPKLLGGRQAVSAVGGVGFGDPNSGPYLEKPAIELLDGDVYLHGRLSSGKTDSGQ